MWNPFRRSLSSSDFSENLAAIISLSRQEAVRLDNDFIHFVHFLLAVLADKSSSVYHVLENSKLDLASLKPELENIFKGRRTKQRGVDVTGSLPITTEFEKAIKHALRIAFKQGAKKVEASHVILGLLQDPANPSASILRDIGLNAELMHSAIHPNHP
jgi:ATP-dependent Clp protease ATP-binding subunit ClpA